MPTTAIYKTLYTPFECKTNSPVANNMDEVRFCVAIQKEEEWLFNNCIGRDFYKALLADKKVYTYTDFIKGTSYLVGSFVLYFGIIYECIQNTTGVQIPSIDTTFFAKTKKFNNSDYNELSESYILYIIAYRVAANALINASIDFTAQGAVRKEGEGFKAADMKELGAAKQQLIDDANIFVQNMNVYLCENKDLFPLYKPFQDSSCGEKGCVTKKYYGFNLQ